MKKSHFIIGLALLSAFLVQDWFGLKWQGLVQMQENIIYKQLSGLLILIFIIHQWYLSVLRIRGNMKIAHQALSTHRLLGICAPLLFFLHSHSLGYAYLFFLSTLFMGNYVLGLCHPSVFHIHQTWFCNLWIVAHVTLSFILIMMVSYHIFISYWYE